MTELPLGWAAATLEDVAYWSSGGTPSRKRADYYGGDIPWVKTGELTSKYIRKTEETLTELGIKNSSAKVFPEGSVGIAMYGATIGKVSIWAIEASTNQACAVARPIEGLVSSEFLYHFLRSQKASLVKQGKGGAQPNISQGLLKLWPIALPPINEQRRIVEKIEALFDEIDKGVESLQTAKAMLGLYRQSLLKSAFEGRLTADWREENADKLEDPETLLARIQSEREARYAAALDEWEEAVAQWRADGETGKKPAKPKKPKKLDHFKPEEESHLPELPKDWLYTKLGCLAFVGTGVTPLKSNRSFYEPPEIPWVTSGVVNKAFVQEPEHYVSAKALQETNLRVYPKGTLLLAMYGEGKTRGKCSELMFPASTNQALAAIQVESTPPHLKSYLKLFLLKNYHDMRLLSSGGVQPNLNMGIVENHWVPICSPAEQAELVRILEAQLEAADLLRAEIGSALTRADALRQSVLKKAFSGELVPQDPSDESASVLLDRVKSEHDKAPKNTKRKARA